MITVFLRQVPLVSARSVFMAKSFVWDEGILSLSMEDGSELSIPVENVAYYTVKVKV